MKLLIALIAMCFLIAFSLPTKAEERKEEKQILTVMYTPPSSNEVIVRYQEMNSEDTCNKLRIATSQTLKQLFASVKSPTTKGAVSVFCAPK